LLGPSQYLYVTLLGINRRSRRARNPFQAVGRLEDNPYWGERAFPLSVYINECGGVSFCEVYPPLAFSGRIQLLAKHGKIYDPTLAPRSKPLRSYFRGGAHALSWDH